ncbi:MAG: hypothetical protein ACYTG7_11830 [Planctomycetota bacterium]|jgi:hypothetical protein
MKKTTRKSLKRFLLFLFLSLITLISLEAAGKDKDKKEGPGPDPYIGEDKDAGSAAGYVRYSPFTLTDSHGTGDVKTLIGAPWMLWVETEHFKIGSTLIERPISRKDPKAVKRLDAELARLCDKLPGLKKKKPKKLDEWLTLHLFAQRLEETYADFSERFGVDDNTFPTPDDEDAISETGLGPYLGCMGKFIVVLFEQQGNMQRYLARYQERYHPKVARYPVRYPESLLFVASADAFRGTKDEEPALHGYVISNVVRNLIDGYRHYKYNLPMWWTEGLTHWYVRRIDPALFFPTLAPDQDCDFRRDPEWEKKVYSRVKKDYFRPASELLAAAEAKDMDFYDHMMAWSRVDHLLSFGPDRAGKFMWLMNDLDYDPNRTFEEILKCQEKALGEAYGLDAESLDAQWSQWVLENYKTSKRSRKP